MAWFVEGAPPERGWDDVEDADVCDVDVTGATVVEPATPTPLGPMLIVFPPMTVVTGVAPLPILYVVPLMTACVPPTEKVSPAAVTPDNTGAAALPPATGLRVVEGPATPFGPRLMVWPFTTTDVGCALDPMA